MNTMTSLLTALVLSVATGFAAADSCADFRSQTTPVLDTFYSTYGLKTYMSLWCARNSQNLYKELKRSNLLPSPESAFAVYMIRNDFSSSIHPLAARPYSLPSWSFHVILVAQGLVLDSDYTKQAVVENFDTYFARMWGPELDQILFQIRPASMITEYTNYAIRESIRANEFIVTDFVGLKTFLNSNFPLCH